MIETPESGLGHAATIPSAWPEVTWDDHGYPFAEDDGFSEWRALPLDFWRAAQFLLEELPRAAERCCASCDVEDCVDWSGRPQKRVSFSTGGWSGAESLIAFIESRPDASYFMQSWRRGGHYVFEIPSRFLASAMSAGTAETAQQAQGQSPASAVPSQTADAPEPQP